MRMRGGSMNEYEKGLRAGIEFAYDEFTSCLPMNLVDKIKEECVNYLIKEYKRQEKEIDNYNGL